MYELRKRLGILRRRFPANPTTLDYLSLDQWRNSNKVFFFNPPSITVAPPIHDLATKVSRIKRGVVPYFFAQELDLQQAQDWVTNPITGYKYDVKLHWTQISDFSKDEGDIKYLWEKSRFSYIYYLIRYDFHSKLDQSKWVFSEIESWMDNNPINMGPNYICSQEISIRLLNWIFVLYYFRSSANLTEDLFQKMMHLIYWQTDHIYENINFSRKIVRNNHAITETLALYVIGMLFPDLPNAGQWKKDGKKWFQEEIEKQIYDDGTYLQFSMNYHRVVVQLLTWALFLSELNGEIFRPSIYNKAQKSLDFLLSQLQLGKGYLPNYGANDGSLFFPLSGADYRDYRPQLNALGYILNKTTLFTGESALEELGWYGVQSETRVPDKIVETTGVQKFDLGGYYTFRDSDTFTMVRCGNHKHRPSQADNLHIDLWYKGHNIMRDAGSFQYNTEEKWTKFFNGTQSHNTIIVNGKDQMKKGVRFIWTHWSQAVFSQVREEEDRFLFSGKIHAFKHLGSKIFHIRNVTKFKDSPHWIIEDEIESGEEYIMTQIWNPSPYFIKNFKIAAFDKRHTPIKPESNTGWYSTSYGIKEKAQQFRFKPSGSYIRTEIDFKNVETK